MARMRNLLFPLLLLPLIVIPYILLYNETKTPPYLVYNGGAIIIMLGSIRMFAYLHIAIHMTLLLISIFKLSHKINFRYFIPNMDQDNNFAFLAKIGIYFVFALYTVCFFIAFLNSCNVYFILFYSVTAFSIIYYTAWIFTLLYKCRKTIP